MRCSMFGVLYIVPVTAPAKRHSRPAPVPKHTMQPACRVQGPRRRRGAPGGGRAVIAQVAWMQHHKMRALGFLVLAFLHNHHHHCLNHTPPRATATTTAATNTTPHAAACCAPLCQHQQFIDIIVVWHGMVRWHHVAWLAMCRPVGTVFAHRFCF